jgi:hypothetical protein
MLRTSSCVIALNAMVAAVSRTAQAADETLTLACQGTTTFGTEDAKSEPISMGIIVNFTNRTVQGFGNPGLMDYPVKITAWNDVTVAFGGSAEFAKSSRNSISGSIDRVTGFLPSATARSTRAMLTLFGTPTLRPFVTGCGFAIFALSNAPASLLVLGGDLKAHGSTFSRVGARAWVFALALGTVVVWAITGPFFNFSDTWQLVINTGTTIVTFLWSGLCSFCLVSGLVRIGAIARRHRPAFLRIAQELVRRACRLVG